MGRNEGGGGGGAGGRKAKPPGGAAGPVVPPADAHPAAPVYQPFASLAAAEAWGAAQYAQDAGALTPAERAALVTYTHAQYRAINNILRGAGAPADYAALGGHTAATTLLGHIQSGLDKGRTTAPVVLYRGLVSHAPERIAALAPGSVFHDAGVLSTTVSAHYAEQWATRHGKSQPHAVIELHVPAGTRGQYVQGLPGTTLQEWQFAVAPTAGPRMRVVSVRPHHTGGQYIVAELIP